MIVSSLDTLQGLEISLAHFGSTFPAMARMKMVQVA